MNPTLGCGAQRDFTDVEVVGIAFVYQNHSTRLAEREIVIEDEVIREVDFEGHFVINSQLGLLQRENVTSTEKRGNNFQNAEPAP